MPSGVNAVKEKLSNDKIKIEEKYYDKTDSFIYLIKSCDSNIELDDNEKCVIEKVINALNKYSTKELVEYMHKEEAYKKTKPNTVISYDYAKYLSL